MNTVTPEQIRELRRATNLSQAQWASILGVARVTVETWETGKRKPSKKHKAGLERLLILMKDPKPAMYKFLFDTIPADFLRTLQLTWELGPTGNVLVLRINMGNMLYKQNESIADLIQRLMQLNKPIVLRPIKNKKEV